MAYSLNEYFNEYQKQLDQQEQDLEYYDVEYRNAVSEFEDGFESLIKADKDNYIAVEFKAVDIDKYHSYMLDMENDNYPDPDNAEDDVIGILRTLIDDDFDYHIKDSLDDKGLLATEYIQISKEDYEKAVSTGNDIRWNKAVRKSVHSL